MKVPASFKVKNIQNHPNYMVTSNGKVYSKTRKESSGRGNTRTRKGRWLKLANNGCYLFVTLDGKPQLVHRLVARAFVDNPLSLPQVNHINGVKTDNRLENLEWTDARGNMVHAYATGLHYKRFGADRKNVTKVTWEDVCKARELHGNGIKQSVILTHFPNLTPSNLNKIVRNKTRLYA